MTPWKCSPYGRLPPIQRGFAETWIVPVVARLDTRLPSTYNRNIAPSYVTATSDQRSTGKAATPLVSQIVPPIVPPPTGTSGPPPCFETTPARSRSAPSTIADAGPAQFRE